MSLSKYINFYSRPISTFQKQNRSRRPRICSDLLTGMFRLDLTILQVLSPVSGLFTSSTRRSHNFQEDRTMVSVSPVRQGVSSFTGCSSVWYLVGHAFIHHQEGSPTWGPVVPNVDSLHWSLVWWIYNQANVTSALARHACCWSVAWKRSWDRCGSSDPSSVVIYCKVGCVCLF